LLKLKGGGPHFLDSQGGCWTAAYIQEGGEIARDLRANNSAEAGARQTYESLIKTATTRAPKRRCTISWRWRSGAYRSSRPPEAA
jgi:Mn-containing catalase